MTLSLAKFTTADEVTLRGIVDTIIRQDKQIGGLLPSKIDARQSGFSLHVKFDRKVDAMTAGDIAQVYDQAASILCHVARKLLDLPDDYEPKDES